MGIPHFSALSEKRKNAFLANPSDFTFQEKIDGSNLKFKLDTAFPWAMRKTASGPVYKSPDEWGTDFWVTGFRASHAALIQSMHKLITTLGDVQIYNGGELLEMEMLFSDTPNTILYDHQCNHLVVYSPEPGHGFIDFTTVTLDNVPVTTDGFTIERTTKTYEFVIQSLDTDHVLMDIETDIYKLVEQYPKDEMPSHLVHYFSGPKSKSLISSNSVRPEGYVFRHKTEGWMFKLVDREWFTAQNTKNYLIRNKLFKSPRGHKQSVMDTFWANIAEGKPVSYAVDKATEKLEAAWGHYQATQEPHIHQRNLEAFASIRYQLRNYTINGVSNEQ
jgi:hypothetical protein